MNVSATQYFADIIPFEFALYKTMEAHEQPLPETYQAWSIAREAEIAAGRKRGDDVRIVAIRFDDFRNHYIMLGVRAIREVDIDSFARMQATRGRMR